LGRYSTPIKGLYLCGASSHTGGRSPAARGTMPPTWSHATSASRSGGSRCRAHPGRAFRRRWPPSDWTSAEGIRLAPRYRRACSPLPTRPSN